MQDQEIGDQNNVVGQDYEQDQYLLKIKDYNTRKSKQSHQQTTLNKSFKQKINLIKQLNRIHLQFINAPNDDVLQIKQINNIQNIQTDEKHENGKQSTILQKDKILNNDNNINNDNQKLISSSIKCKSPYLQQIFSMNIKQQNDSHKENIQSYQYKMNNTFDNINNSFNKITKKQTNQNLSFNYLTTEPNFTEKKVYKFSRVMNNCFNNSFDTKYQQQNQISLKILNNDLSTEQINNKQYQQVKIDNTTSNDENYTNFNFYQKICMNQNTINREQINPVQNQDQINQDQINKDQNNIIQRYQNETDSPEIKYFKFELFEQDKLPVKNYQKDNDQKQQNIPCKNNLNMNEIPHKSVFQTSNIKQNNNNYKFQQVHNGICQDIKIKQSLNNYISQDDNKQILSQSNKYTQNEFNIKFKEINNYQHTEKLNESKLFNNHQLIQNEEIKIQNNKIKEEKSIPDFQNTSKSKQNIFHPQIQNIVPKRIEENSYFKDMVSQKNEILNISNQQLPSSNNLKNDNTFEKSEESSIKKKNESMNIQQDAKLTRYNKIRCNQTQSPLLFLKSDENMKVSSKCITLPSQLQNVGRNRVLSQQCSKQDKQTSLKIGNTSFDIKIEDVHDQINQNDQNAFEQKKKCQTPQHISYNVNKTEQKIKLNNSIVQQVREKIYIEQKDNLENQKNLNVEDKRLNKFTKGLKYFLHSYSPKQKSQNNIEDIRIYIVNNKTNQKSSKNIYDKNEQMCQLQNNKQNIDSDKQISISDKKQKSFLEMSDNNCISSSSIQANTQNISQIRSKTQQNYDDSQFDQQKMDFRIRPKTQQSFNRIKSKNAQDNIRNTANYIKSTQNQIKNISNNIKCTKNNLKYNLIEIQNNLKNIQNNNINISNSSITQQNESKKSQKTLNSLKIRSQFPSVSLSAKSTQDQSLKNKDNQFKKFSDQPKFKIRSFTQTNNYSSQEVKIDGSLNESNLDNSICKKIELSEIKLKQTNAQRRGCKTANITSKGVSLKSKLDFNIRFNSLKKQAQQNLEPQIKDIKYLIETSCRNQRRSSSSNYQFHIKQKNSKSVRFQGMDMFRKSQENLSTQVN